MNDFREDHLNLVAFGPGRGESLLIFIPSLGWGVIDSLIYKGANPALLFLQENNVKRLAFAVLTHLHEDHYRGLDQLIEYYSGHIDRVCYPHGDGIREYAMYLAANELLGAPGYRALIRLLERFREAEQRGATRIRLGEKTTIVRSPKVEIEALCPSARSIEKYVEILHKAIPQKDGDTIDFVIDSQHNLISAALWIKTNGIVMILGGDVEAGEDDFTGWKGVLRSIDCPNLSSQVVKVPHHGSRNALHIPAWERFTDGRAGREKLDRDISGKAALK